MAYNNWSSIPNGNHSTFFLHPLNHILSFKLPFKRNQIQLYQICAASFQADPATIPTPLALNIALQPTNSTSITPLYPFFHRFLSWYFPAQSSFIFYYTTFLQLNSRSTFKILLLIFLSIPSDIIFTPYNILSILFLSLRNYVNNINFTFSEICNVYSCLKSSAQPRLVQHNITEINFELLLAL